MTESDYPTVACFIEHDPESHSGSIRVRLDSPAAKKNKLQEVTFTTLDEALAWIKSSFLKAMEAWEVSQDFPQPEIEEETLRDVIYFVPDPYTMMPEVEQRRRRQMLRRVDEVYDLAAQLPRFDHTTPRESLPKNGIYLFYEKGETVSWRDKITDRIVRIGTHRQHGRFPTRIRQHYGRVKSLRGNKNGSIFRKHVGSALLRQHDTNDPRLAAWLGQRGGSDPTMEEMVSQTLRDGFTFSCFSVPTQEERMELERGLIALLAQFSPWHPSKGWLGRYAANETIREYGLWNVQRTRSSPISAGELRQLGKLIDAMG